MAGSKTAGAKGQGRMSRRSLMKGSATAALVAAAKSLVPGGATVAWAAGPETTRVVLGYIALTDAAPLIVAKEQGFFTKHGLPDVEVVKQASWGATRDNLVLGSDRNGIDGAHILTPMPYLISAGKVTQIIEKPAVPPSNYAVTGLYLLDGRAPELARKVTPSARGELEITTLLEMYLAEGTLEVKRMGRGFAWLDTGTHGSLLDAGNFVRTLQQRQGMQTGCPEEIAYHNGWIDRAALLAHAERLSKNDYGRHLRSLIDEAMLSD